MTRARRTTPGRARPTARAGPAPARAAAKPAEGSARSRLQADTRKRLVVAGARAFARLGYHGVRIAAVARDAGVANGTFYLHFRDKDALLRAVLGLALEELAARLRAVESAERDALASERRELEVIVDFAAEHADLLRAGLAQGARASADAVRLLVAQRARALVRSIAEGRARADVDPEIAALADIGMLTFVLQWWVDRRDRVSREKLLDTLSALRRGGLGLRPAPGGPA